LADGTYNITARATDIAANTGDISAAFTITINTVDSDSDGIADFCDDDDDGNGVDDVDEDCDGDGIIDSQDTDNSACTSGILQTRSYGFSPNGDGVNDGWTIENITAFPNNTVSVYSRSGKLVFKKKGYQNDWEAVSNQISNSGIENRLPVGPYIYVIDLGDGGRPLRGWLYINY
jgi:gliding motility-associated-like protein